MPMFQGASRKPVESVSGCQSVTAEGGRPRQDAGGDSGGNAGQQRVGQAATRHHLRRQRRRRRRGAGAGPGLGLSVCPCAHSILPFPRFCIASTVASTIAQPLPGQPEALLHEQLRSWDGEGAEQLEQGAHGENVREITRTATFASLRMMEQMDRGGFSIFLSLRI